MISPAQAAFAIGASSLCAKLSMSALWRAPTKEGEDARKTEAFQLWSRAQLNVAEYDGPIMAMLLYLAAKGVASPWGATLTCAGQLIYFWGRAVTGMKVLPFTPIGALPRYIGMGCLLYSVYGTSRKLA